MNTLSETAPAFVSMAHKIVWAAVATVDPQNRPRSRVLHPFWEWDGNELVGWVGTGATPTKRSNLEHTPYVSINYWAPDQDNCIAECRSEWFFDDATCRQIWDRYKALPPPLGYDPAMIPNWDEPESESFSVLKFYPWRLKVFPGAVLMGGEGEVFTWQAESA